MSTAESRIRRVRTAAIEVAIRERGTVGRPAVLFLHGNLSSSIFWEATIAEFAGEFHCIAPDLRGFGATDALPIRAFTGIDDMAGDVFALSEALGLERFHIVGHSMGGGVAMKMLLQQPRAVAGVSLVNPISPFGYGGSRDEQGTPCFPGWGASRRRNRQPRPGRARLRAGDRTDASPLSPRNLMTAYYFKPPFVPRDLERLLDGMLATRWVMTGIPRCGRLEQLAGHRTRNPRRGKRHGTAPFRCIGDRLTSNPNLADSVGART